MDKDSLSIVYEFIPNQWEFLLYLKKEGMTNDLKYTDWNAISFNSNLSEEFILKFKNNINWNVLCYSQDCYAKNEYSPLDGYLYKTDVDIKSLKNTTLTQNIFLKCDNYLNFNYLFHNVFLMNNLEKPQMKKYLPMVLRGRGWLVDLPLKMPEVVEYLNEHGYGRIRPFGEVGDRLKNKILLYIREFADRMVWRRVDPQKYSIEFVREFADRMDWIFAYPRKYPVEFVREFAHRMDWDFARPSEYPIEFVREFEDRLYWGGALPADYPNDFVIEFAHRFEVD